MAAAPEGREHASICLKHNPKWSNRVYWVLNKLNVNVIPQKYQRRVGSLLCTCDRRADLPPRNDPFLNVTDDQLLNAVKEMDLFLITNNRHPSFSVFEQLMEWMRKDNIIVRLTSGESQQIPESHRGSSAYKLLYILHQCLVKNFQFLEPPPLNQPELASKSLVFDLENCHHNFVSSIIGRNGFKLRPLLKTYKCHIKVEKVPDRGELKIRVTITKKTESMETLERVKRHIQEMAKEVVEDEERFKERKRAHERHYKETFKELLQETGIMSRTVTWNDVLRAIIASPNFFTLNRIMGPERIRQWFSELQEEWEEPASEEPEPEPEPEPDPAPSSTHSGTPSDRAFEGSGSSIVVHHNEFSDEEPDDTNLKGASAGPTRMSRNGLNAPGQPVPSTSGTMMNSQSVTRGEMSPSSSDRSLNQHLSTAREGRLTTNDRPSLCLVHDRRWVATYQFTLTRCYSEINLEKKHGRSFSRFVCCCQGNVPECTQHFQSDDQMKANFKTVIDKIKNWPEGTEDIMSPLIRQLEKGKDADTWHSLYRFVFLYINLLAGKKECLQPGYGLPYDSQNSSGEISIVTHPVSGNVPSSPSVVATSTAGTSASTSIGKKGKVAKADRNEDCYFHGTKKRAQFQCVVNYLHKTAGMPQKYHMPFCKSVCCCMDDESSPPIYQSPEDKQAGCLFMKTRLSLWRGDSSVSVQQYITKLDQYLNDNVEHGRGFEKLVFYFNCAYKREFDKFEK